MNQPNPAPRSNSHLHPEHYSAKLAPKLVNFICAAPFARRVTLVGDFNDWQPEAFLMKRQPDGHWHLQIPLGTGAHHYQFLVDGKPMLDPTAQRVARNESDEKVSLVEVV